MTESLIVAKQHRRTRNLRQDHIQIAIPIDIRKRRTSTDDRLEKITTALVCRNSFETHTVFVPAVPEEVRRLTIMLKRIHTVDFRLQMPIGGQDIQSAVEVIIKKE